MGANQSSGKQFVLPPGELLARDNKSTSKNSFTRNQLNKLLRKNLHQQQQQASSLVVASSKNNNNNVNNNNIDYEHERYNEHEVASNGYKYNQHEQQQQQVRSKANDVVVGDDDDGGFAHSLQRKQKLMRQQQQSSLNSCATVANNKPQQLKALKSSCSPSSSGSSSAASSSLGARRVPQLARIVNTPKSSGSTNCSTNAAPNVEQQQQQGKLNSERANNYATTAEVAMQQQQQRVAAYYSQQQAATIGRQQQHQRAHSSGGGGVGGGGGGGSLSWCKQWARGGCDGGGNLINGTQYNYDSLESYHQPPPQAANEIEQYYSRNLHLLTTTDQQVDNSNNNSLLLLAPVDHHQQLILPEYPHANGFASAPQQRRRLPTKRPKAQYQYFNNNNNAEFVDINSTPINANYLPTNNESLIYYNNLNNNQQLEHYIGGANYLPISAKSATLGRSKTNTLSSTPKRSRNPLAGIFPFVNNNNNNSSSSTTTTNTPHKQFNSNTFHLSSSKSHSNLHNYNNNRNAGGSLKRVKSSPLTAQQTSYEAMRTIDMYLIRQIARSCMDFEMEQKIELEIRLRELASQSLLEARNEIDVLEVEKSLLTSDQRMNCYAGQLEAQRKQLSSTASLSTDSGRASKTSTTTTTTAHRVSHHRRDNSPNRNVIVQQQQPEGEDHAQATTSGTGSPSFSCLSKSSQSSPSKLSPVSGESANSQSTSGTNKLDATCLSSSSAASSSCHRSRRRSDQLKNARQLTSGGGGGTNTVGRRGSTNKSSRARERLRQSITGQSNINCNMVMDNKATLTLSELRIPLMWRDVDHFKGRGDYRRYAVFCLLKIGSQIYDTQLISDVDRQMTDLTFDDVIVFNNSIDHEFELTLEVYSCVYLEQFSLSSTPRKLKEKLSNSVSRAMGRRLATQTASANYTKELEAYDKSYRFAMIASAQLRLPDVADSIKTYDLLLVSPEAHGRRASQHQLSSEIIANYNHNHQQLNSLAGRNYQHSAIVTSGNQKDVHKNTLPLFGHFCCKLHVRPDVFDKCVKSGYLKIASINLSELVAKHRGDSEDRRSKSRSDSPINSSDKSSSSNDDLNSTITNDNSMLRSALAASSKLATISLSTSTVHWALLRNFTLHLWHIDEQKLQVAARRGHAPQVDISGKQPFCLSIDKFTRLLRVSNSSLTIETDKGCFVIAVYEPNEHTRGGANHDEIGQWLRPIEQMIYDSHIWGSVLNHYPPAQRNKSSKQ